MRHTITISGNSQIKNQRIHCKKLPNFQQESIVKIQQGNKKVYAIYTPDSSTQRSQISLMYMKMNDIQESLATMSKIVNPPKLKYVQIEVSQIDYELVNNNFGLLERSFLDQVNLVWPQGKIPLFYKEGSYITLMPKVSDIHLVDPYAAISFMIKQQNKNNQQKLSQQQNDSEQNEFNQKVLVLNNVDQLNTVNFGYDNTIYLQKEEFQLLKKFRLQQNSQSFRSFYCTVQPLSPFLSNPTFQQFQQYKKLQSANKIPQLKPILVQITSNQKQQQQNQLQKQEQLKNYNIQQLFSQQQLSFTCSQICKLSLGLPQKLLLAQQNLQYNQGFETISLQMFLKQLTLNKYLINLQLSNHKILSSQLKQNLKNTFITQFFKFLRENKEFVFLQNYYPFLIENHVCGLVLQKLSANKKNYEVLKNFLVVKDISANKNENSQNENRIKSVIQKSLTITQYLQNQRLNQWLPIMKKLQQNYSRKNQDHQKSDKSFQTIFQTCYKKQLSQCIQYLTEQIRDQTSYSKILVSTYSSNGKTYLHTYLSSLTKNSQLKTTYRSWYIDCRALIHPNNRIDEIKQYLDTVVTLCPYRLVFIDNVDSLMPLIQQGDQMRQRQKISSHVLGNYLFDLLQSNSKIAIFTAKAQANIDPIFKFNKSIKLKNPNRQLRSEIVHSLIKSNKDNAWIEQFIDKTESFSLGSMAHYLMSQQIPVKKQSKRKNDFSKIVGLSQAKRVICSVIQKPNKFGFIYDKVKIKVPRGILLYGATGNGKTALGSAVQDEFPMKYFSVKGSDILSKYIGGSEAAVREIFEKALSVAPSIIFFDEFESIVPRRNSSGTGVTDRVVNQFLCYLDGVSSTTGVFIIAASSRPDLIDPALLRPGRIDSHIYLQYPKQNERAQLLSLFNNSIKLQVSDDQFVQSTSNYSYSDLIGLLKELRIKKSSLILKEKQNPSVQQFKYINKQLFYDTIKSYRIGTDLQQQKTQTELYERFKSGKGPQIKKQKFIQM